jgi:hypothetical protein
MNWKRRLQIMKMLWYLIPLALIACQNVTGVGQSQIEKLDARITEIRECVPMGDGCRPGELLNRNIPLDTAAVFWNYRFVLIGQTDYAGYVFWYAEFDACKKVGRCGLKHRGPLVPAPGMVWFVAIKPEGPDDLQIILEAKLQTRAVADTIVFLSPEKEPPPPPR